MTCADKPRPAQPFQFQNDGGRTALNPFNSPPNPKARMKNEVKPIRVQLSRKKGWRKPENTVVVARPSKWGNPFKVGRDGNARTCADAYREMVRANPIRMHQIRYELEGCNLACWCKLGTPCHADVLLEIANA